MKIGKMVYCFINESINECSTVAHRSTTFPWCTARRISILDTNSLSGHTTSLKSCERITEHLGHMDSPGFLAIHIHFGVDDCYTLHG